MENRIKFSGRYRFLGLLGVYFACLAIYLLVCLLALGEMGGAFFVGVATLPIWSKGWRILDPILGVETARWEQWVSLLALAAFVGWQWGAQGFPVGGGDTSGVRVAVPAGFIRQGHLVESGRQPPEHLPGQIGNVVELAVGGAESDLEDGDRTDPVTAPVAA